MEGMFSGSEAGGRSQRALLRPRLVHPWCVLLPINSTRLHVKGEAVSAGGTTSAWSCSDATGGVPARICLSFAQPSDSRSLAHPAQDFAASTNASTWKMPHPAPRAVLSLQSGACPWAVEGHAQGDGPGGAAETSRLWRDPHAGAAFVTGAGTAKSP